MRDIRVYRALKNDKGAFREIEGAFGKKIEEVIPDFFKQRASGVHVVILCTDNDQLSIDEFIVLFVKAGGNVDRKIVSLKKRNDKDRCQCAVYQIRSLLEIYNYVFLAIEAGDLLDYCEIKDLNEIFSLNEKMNYDRKFSTIFKNIDVAESLSLFFQEDENHVIPELRLMIILPSDKFDQFKNGYFATILEYVVLEMPLDREGLVRIVEELKQKEANSEQRERQIVEKLKQFEELLLKAQKGIENCAQKEDLVENPLHNNYNKDDEKIIVDFTNFINEMYKLLKTTKKIIEEDKKFEKPINKIGRNNTYVSSEKNKKSEENYSESLAENSEENDLEGRYGKGEDTQIKGKDKEREELLNEKSTEIQKKEDHAKEDKER